uniref:Variant surface glycoprotein 1125.4810 n=1 Tax=Trypanosoma brucei TaxID=5691 RepID=A0A1J0RAR8_9TRYP|nr:variant surface glycoprotein 1125.4810 [Trypanosoma brucei]
MARALISFKETVVLTIISVSQATASEFCTAGDSVTRTCKEAEFFAATATWLYKELQHKFNAISSMETERQSYELAAAAAKLDPLAANKYKALAIFTALCQERATAQYQRQLTAINDYAGKATAWAALILGQALVTDIKYTQKGRPTMSDSNGKADIKLTPIKAAENTCINTKLESKMADGKELELPTIKRLKISNPQTLLKPFSEIKIQLQATTAASDTPASSQTVFHGTQNADKIVKTHSSSNDKGFKVVGEGATAAAYEAAAGIDIGKAAETPRDCIDKPAESDKLIPKNNQMRHSLCTALKELKLGQASPATGNFTLLSTDTDFKKIAAAILLTPEQQLQQKGKTDTTLIDQKIKDLYGPSDAEFTTNFITNIVNQNIQYLNNGQNAQKIAHLTGSNEAAEAPSYLLRTKEVTVKENSPKTQKNNCKPRTKSECQPEIGCKWEGNDENGE